MTRRLSTEALGRFAGTYTAELFGKINIAVQGDHLIMTNERLGSVPLFPAKGTTFFSLGESPDVTFSVDDRGTTVGLGLADSS